LRVVNYDHREQHMDRLDVGIRVLSVVLTFLAVLVALFGDWFRRWVAGPRLQIVLDKPTGELTQAINVDESEITPAKRIDDATKPSRMVVIRSTPIRYYHLKVFNETWRGWIPATEVQAVVLRVESKRGQEK